MRVERHRGGCCFHPGLAGIQIDWAFIAPLFPVAFLDTKLLSVYCSLYKGNISHVYPLKCISVWVLKNKVQFMFRNSTLEPTDFEGICYEYTCRVRSPRSHTFQYPTIRITRQTSLIRVILTALNVGLWNYVRHKNINLSLTFQIPVITICSTSCDIKKVCRFPHGVCVFRVIDTINTALISEQN